MVTVAMLEALGLHRRTVSRRCRPGGPWSSLALGIVKLGNGPPTRDDHRHASLLHAGPGAVLTGLDALALHGLRNAPAPFGPIHVLVPHARRRAGAGVALLERTHRLPDPEPGRWPLAPIPRAVCDFARRSRDRNAVRTVVAEVVQRGRCTVSELVEELERGSSRGTAIVRDVLREISDGVRSVAEAEARALVLRSGLTAPLWNPRLEDDEGHLIAFPDAWFDDVGLAWEIDSVEYHLSPADYARTVRRRSSMMAKGVVVMQTLPSDLRTRPRDVLAELHRCHEQAALLPTPALTAVPAEP
ncbi:hypothetical protein EV383_3889 [Pseudonocardia sediminis]|uniref:Transcriptional regulator, AbiEi antitoxin, Type IV TA system n=1 Tax=Pseudonocardia sediminis TaxID=1397368 RepID=A0A4Q7V0N4_PSEST|nr:hypothetical protein [Pseudonocardia sediminis]RZT86984.1 hypothetical protein EV383_3889 [Pseudonocardia sediminis]